MPKVSVITVNYNGKGLTTLCLNALNTQTFQDFEVIVVDNGSSDGSLAELQEFLGTSTYASRAMLIPIGRNAGFGGANLEGLKHAGGEYIALLNNDTEPDRRWLEELVQAMEGEPSAGICASKLVAFGTQVIDSAGDGFSTSLKGFKRGEGEIDSEYNMPEYVFGACAGAALYRREMIDQIGFLDETFFLIHEDTDLNFRAQLSGWKVLYVPTALVPHKVRSTIGTMSNTAVYFTLRNSELVRIKNVPLPLALRYLPLIVIGAITEFLYFAVKHRHPILFFKAKLDAAKMLPKAWKKRQANMKMMKVRSQDLRRAMTPSLRWPLLKRNLRKLVFG